MLKTRTWIKLGVGLVILLLAVFIAILAWPTSPPSPEAVAKLGLKAPEKRSALWNGTFGSARDWMDQNLDMLANWEGNPLGYHRNYFSQHLMELKASKDPKDQEEYRRLIELTKKWHENLLSRYPELRGQDRNVPDDRNALKLLSALRKRLHEAGLKPGELGDKDPRDAKAAQAWLDANRAASLDEFRTICLMPESLGKDFGMDANDLVFCIDGSRALLMEARLAAVCGDWAASMKSVEAAMAVANHLQESDAFSLFGGSLRAQVSSMVFESILPNLPAGQTDLAVWEDLLHPSVQTPADFARTLRGQWNRVLQYQMLPALVDPGGDEIPADSELMVEAYTSYVSRSVEFHTPLSLSDLPSRPAPTFYVSDLSRRSQNVLEGILVGERFRSQWEQQQIRTGLTQAAFAILKGQPVPNDPIYGKPYSWNPETRELSLPESPEFSKMYEIRLKLPKR